jgi:L-galactose dehydrogenase
MCLQYNSLGKTGIKVSKLGLGGAQLGDAYGKLTDDDVCRIVHAAFDLGINFLDTAPLYGMGESERRIGLALKGRARDQYVLTTKIGLKGRPYDYQGTMASVENSLKLLQTEYVDLIQVHDAEQMDFDTVMNETVPALVQLKEQGHVRALGVSSRDLPLLMKYMRTGAFDTIQFYNRHVLIDYTARDEVIPFANEQGIAVINGSSMAMGILADNPVSWLNKDVVELARKRMDQIEFLRGKDPGGLIEPAMRFSLSNPNIHVTLTGASTVEQLQQNAGFCDGRGLSEEDERRLLSLFPGQKLSE